MNPKVSIILLNWNGWEDTIECLESLYQINYSNYNVIVIDNGSEDESLYKIKEYCKGKIKIYSDFFEYNLYNKPIDVLEINNIESDDNLNLDFNEFTNLNQNKKLILIRNDKNYGFAEGNNIGNRFAQHNLNPDYILLLNNDTVVDNCFLDELTKIGNKNKKFGILGPTINSYNNKNQIESAGAKINWNRGTSSVLNHLQNGKSMQFNQVDYVSGCALLVKTELIRKIGFLNSKYFAYWEETDFCIKANKEGYKVINVPKSKIWHKLSASTGKKGLYNYYITRNMFWFMKQHATITQRFSCFLYFFFYRIWYESFIIIMFNKDTKSWIYLLKGTSDGLFKSSK